MYKRQDMILEDSVNIFIYSKMKQRIKRLMELEPEEGINEKDVYKRQV